LVNSAEIIPSLVEPAHEKLAKLGLDHVHILLGDGEGLSKDAPYDRAIFTAGSHDVNMRAYLSSQKTQTGPNEWVVRRGDADLIYSLP